MSTFSLPSRFILAAALLLPLGALAQSPTITATKSDGTPAATKKVPGDTVTYTNVISNTGTGNATGVQFTDPDVNGSAVQMSTLKVSPIAFDDLYTGTIASGVTINTTLSTNFSVVSNDYVGIYNNAAGVLTITAFDATSVNGGTVTMVTSGADIGKFTYTSAGGFTGADSFTYTISNTGFTATGTVSLTVSGPAVWYVNDTTGNDTTGKGTLALPFKTLTKVATVDAASHRIFVFSGAYTAGITLEANEQLFGQGVVGASFDTVVLGITPGSDSVARPTIGGTKPTITTASGNVITLADGNVIRGVAITSTVAGFGVAGTAIPSMQLGSSGAGNAADTTVTSSSASSGCLSLTGAAGGTVNILAVLNNSAAAGRAFTVSNRSSGAVSFIGKVTDSGNTGLSLSSNTGANINLRSLALNNGGGTSLSATGGGTVILTAGDSDGIDNDGDGLTDESDEANTLANSAGNGLVVANTTIGASNLTFRRIDVTASSGVGISLDTTGSSGGLIVTGDGTNAALGGNGSGGTITGKTGADQSRTSGIGIYLNNTSNVSLLRMVLSGTHQNFGIRGNNVAGFSLAYSTLSGTFGTNLTNFTGDSYGEGVIYFGNNGGASADTDAGSGNFTFTSNIIAGGRARNLSVVDSGNTGGDLRLNITNCSFGLTQNVTGTHSVALETRTASTVSHSTVQGCTFAGQAGDNLNFTGQTGTTQHIIVGGAGGGQANTLGNTHAQNTLGGCSLTLSTSGIQFFDVRNNTMTGANGSAVTIFKASTGTQQEGVFDSNTIGTSGVVNSGSVTGNGIYFSDAGAGTVTVSITNNIIQRYANAGILADNTGGTYAVNLTITGNTVRQPAAAAFAALGLTNGSPSGTETTNVFARILNNDFSDGDPFNFNDILIAASGSSAPTHTFTLSGATALDVVSIAAIQTFLQNNNNLNGAAAATVASAYADAPATVSQFKASAALPPTPTAPTPLLFAPGGIEKTAPAAPLADASTSPAAEGAITASAQPQAPAAQELPLLTQDQLTSLVAVARQRWDATGLTAAQQKRLDSLTFEVANLDGLRLGEADGLTIRVDADGGTCGWYVGAGDDAFASVSSATRRYASPSEAPAGRLDLLTALLHEMGHTLGLEDSYLAADRDNLMYGFLTKGERRLPAMNQAQGAVPHEDGHSHFLTGSINIGVLPPGKSVTISYDVIVDNPVTTAPLTSQGTVSGGNFANVLTDDLVTPGDSLLPGSADPTVTLIDRPDANVVSLTRQSANPSNAGTVTWQIVFSQAVSNLSASNFSLVNTGLGGTPAISGVTPASGPPSTTWSISATTGTGDGTLGLNLANDAALSHDVLNAPFTGQVFTLDRTPPVFTSITRQTPSAQNTNADTLTFRAAFSETVVGVDATDFTVSGTTATITGITGTGPYDLTVSGGDLANLNGTVSLALAVGQNIADAAGNALPGTAPATNQTYTVDNTAPTVSMASATGDPAPNAAIPVTVTFSESVTGFIATDITPGNATVQNFAGSGSSYTFNLVPTGPGVTATADIAAGVCTDDAGNSNAAATQFSRVITDSVNVTATTPTAVEGGATGLYTFTRGNSSGAITVNFQLDVSSTATAGTDFTLSGTGVTFDNGTGLGSVIIPDTATSATVTLTALTESPNPAEVAETARLNVQAGTGYAIGVTPNATVTIAANSFLVTTTADSGTGSLRQAVLNANAIAGADTITFSDGTGGTVNFTDGTPDTISLSGGQISLDSDITIAGPGADLLIIQNTAALSSTSRVFNVSTASITVRLSGLTITGGNCAGSGGGLLVSANATVNVIACAITGNSATAYGAGIRHSVGALTVVSSTISGNTAGGLSGGGAIDSSSGALTLTNSTVSGNSITGSSSSNGGGIYVASTTTTIRGCTITNNTGVGGISGMRIVSGAVTVSNSIIAGNVNNTTLPDVGGAFTSGGGNLIGNKGTATGFTNGTNSDQVGTGASPIDPLLAALANNGGPTQTHAFLPGSPALNAGLNAQIPADTFDLDGDTNTAEAIPFDQRGSGFLRAVGTVDIGAYELQKSVNIAALSATNAEGTGAGTTAFTFTVSRTGSPTGDVTMNYAVTGGVTNPANADDFGGTLPSGTVTIPDTQASTTLTINVSQDTLVEVNETFAVTLSNPDNGYVVATPAATGTITNDDTATVSIAKITDGNEGPPIVNGLFRVTMTATSSTNTVVNYSVSGTATPGAGNDYATLSGSVTVLAGNTTADITVTVQADGVNGEPTETVIASLTGTDNTSITVGAPTSATVNILSGPRPVSSSLGDVVTSSGAPDSTGAADGNFNVMGRGGYLSANGVLGFPGTLQIGGSITNLNNQGYWKDDGTGLKRLVRSSDVMPGANGASLDALPTIPVPGINSVGQVTLLGTLRIGTGTVPVTASDDTAMWSEAGGSGLRMLARENDPVTGVSGAFIASFGFGCYATATTGPSTGEAAFTIKMKGTTTQAALIRRSITGPGTGTNAVIAREASAAPGVAGQNFGALNSSLTNAVRMDPTGNLVFEAQMKPNNKFGIWYQPVGGAVSKVFVANDVAPGTSNATFLSFDLPSMGSGGTVAFHATLNANGDNATNAKNSAIWRGLGTGPYTAILRRGDPALPGMVGGSKVGNLWNGWLNLANHGAWKGWVDTGGDGINPYPIDTFGIYSDIGGTMRLLISAGDSAPGIAGATMATIDHPVVSGHTAGSEYVAFLGTVTGGGVTAGVNDKGIWRSTNGGAPILILRTGDSLPTSPPGLAVFDIDIPGSGQDVRAWEQTVMDDSGHILVNVLFTDGSTAQVIAQ